MNKIITHTLSTLLLLLSFSIAQAQELNYSWVKHVGGESFDLAIDMALDADNNLHITGNFENESLFGSKELKSAGSFDIFLAKYDKNGQLLWLKKFGGKSLDQAASLTLDSKGNIYLSGRFRGECNFGKSHVKAKGFMDSFIAKLNPDGEMVWLNTFAASTKAEKGILALDNQDNLYYASSFYKTIELDNNRHKATSSSDIIIARLDDKGNFIKAIQVEGHNHEKLKDMAFDADNNLFITGSFTGTMNVGRHDLNSNGKQDIFLAKFEGLKPIWLKQAGGYYTDYASKITITGENIVLTGSFTDMAEFGQTSLLSEGVLDGFVCSYNTRGEVLWAKEFGGKANEYTNSVLSTHDGSIYISGSYRGKIQGTGDEIESDSFSKDIFLTRFSKKGELLWTKSLGGTKNDFAVHLLKDKEDYFYQVGAFNKNLKIGKEKALTNGKANDFFITKFYDCGLSPDIDLGGDCTLCAGTILAVKGEFETYLWNTNSTEPSITIAESGTYSVTATDKYGCSSTDEIEIDIVELPIVNLGSDITAAINEPIEIGAEGEFTSYLWSDGSTGKTLVLPAAKMDKTGLVLLTVTDENNCPATDEIKVSWGASPSQTDYFDINGLGNQAYSVFPNPTNGKFSILANKPEGLKQIEIFDLAGTKIKTYKDINGFPFKVDLFDQPRGAYVVVVNEPNRTYQFKVVVE